MEGRLRLSKIVGSTYLIAQNGLLYWSHVNVIGKIEEYGIP